MAITTNRQYIATALNRFGLTDSDVDMIIVENPVLDGDLNITACKEAMYKSMSAILPVANVSEGGYSISWNIDGLKLWYASLCGEIGKPNALKPRIVNKSNVW